MKITASELLVEHKLDKSYWGKRIIAAEHSGRFTQEDCKDSGRWTTCACGRQSPKIPRIGPHGAPVDGRLLSLGNSFYQAICEGISFLNGEHGYRPSRRFVRAARVLIAIEKRAQEVLRSVE